MIDVNWDDNAKTAVREFADYIGQQDHCERYLKFIIAQTKTVADNIIRKDDYGTHFVGKKKTVADAKEQESEKWTHVYGPDLKCRILAVDDDHAWILTESGSKFTEYTESLKPIKPTLSESKALHLMRTMCPDEWAALDSKYDII